MHLIYAYCALCIVAKAGEDASYGLRGIFGVSSRRWKEQAIFELADGERLACNTVYHRTQSNVKPEHPTPGGSYDERAWTFQEYFFSRRRLIFDYGGISFLCCTQTKHEDIVDEPQYQGQKFSKIDTDSASQWMNSRIPSLRSLSYLVGRFAARWLTYPEDALKAFSGIQSLLHITYADGLLFGLPEFFFDIALLWDVWVKIPGSQDITKRFPSTNFKQDPAQDRLPSWSWLGWSSTGVNDIMFPLDLEYEVDAPRVVPLSMVVGIREPVTEWYTMDLPHASGRRKINSRWYDFKMMDQDGRGQLPDGWTRDADISKHHRDSPRRYRYKHSSDPRRQSWYPVPVVLDKKTRKLTKPTQYLFCVTARAYLAGRIRPRKESGREQVILEDGFGNRAGVLTYHGTDHLGEFPRPVKDIELVAVCKGWSKSEKGERNPCYFVLWIRWKDGVAKRQGVGHVNADVWDRCKEAEPVDLILG